MFPDVSLKRLAKRETSKSKDQNSPENAPRKRKPQGEEESNGAGGARQHDSHMLGKEKMVLQGRISYEEENAKTTRGKSTGPRTLKRDAGGSRARKRRLLSPGRV